MPSPVLPHRTRRSSTPDKLVLFPASPLLSPRPFRDRSPRPKKKKISFFSFYYHHRSTEKGEPEPVEPTSPKISCIGQVIAKQKKGGKKAKKDEEKRGNYPFGLQTEVSLESYDDDGDANEEGRSAREIKKYASLFRGGLHHVNEEQQSDVENASDDELHCSGGDEHYVSVTRRDSNIELHPRHLIVHKSMSRNDEKAPSVEKTITLKELFDSERRLSREQKLPPRCQALALPSLHCERSNDSRMIVSYDVVPETWLLPSDESSSSSRTPALMSIVPRRSSTSSSIHKAVRNVQMNDPECVPIFPFTNSSIHGSCKTASDYCSQDNANHLAPNTALYAPSNNYDLAYPRCNVKRLALTCSEKKRCPTTSVGSGCMPARTGYDFALPQAVQRHFSPVSLLDEGGVGSKKKDASMPVQFITRLVLVGLDHPKQVYHQSWQGIRRFNNAGSASFCPPTVKDLRWLKGGAGGAVFIRSFSATSHRTAIIQLQRSNSEPSKHSSSYINSVQ